LIILFKNCSNSNQQGVIGLAEAISYFTKLRCTVSLSLMDSQDYDLIVDDFVGLRKVQVKTTATRRSGCYVVRLVNGSSCDRKVKLNTDKVYDFLLVVTECREVYLIPKPDIDHLKHSITLGTKYKNIKF